MTAIQDPLDITCHTLIDALDKAAQINAGVTFIHWGDQEEYISYSMLLEQSSVALGYLQQLGLRKGTKVILYVEDNKSFLVTYWACLLGGIIPAPLAVGSQDDHKEKVLTAFDVLDDSYIITDAQNRERLVDFDHVGVLSDQHVFIDIAHMNDAEGPGVILRPKSEELAYIQFSSGSTGCPKGVELTHSNVLCSILDIAGRSAIQNGDCALSWIPLANEKGLICFHLTALLKGIQQYLIPISLFVRRPLLWIEKTHEHHATLLYATNFGFRYFLDALGECHADWDLHKVRLIYNGTEPISHQLCLDFVNRLSVFGMDSNVMYPSYGMAEASAVVSLPAPGMPLKRHDLDRYQLTVGDKIVTTSEESNDKISFVENGFPIDHCEVRIADDEDQVLPEGHIGHIQIFGHNVTSRYHRNSRASLRLKTEDDWVRTGDVGFMLDGFITITGRQKDIIIFNGINYYPKDIERAAMLDYLALAGRIVATTVPVATGERLILFVHSRDKAPVFKSQVDILKRRVFERVGIAVDEVIQVQRLPKTTNGKVQVFKLRQSYLDGEFDDQRAVTRMETKEIQEITPEALQQVWMVLFGYEALVDEDLRMLGLKSIGAYRFSFSIKKEFGLELTVSEIFEHNSLLTICQALNSENATNFSKMKVIDQQPNQSLSLSENFFLHLSESQPENGLGKMLVNITFDGKVNAKKLKAAFGSVVRDFDALRIIYQSEEGVITQRLADTQEIELPWNDLVLPAGVTSAEFIEGLGLAFYRKEYALGNLLFEVHFLKETKNEGAHMLFFSHHSLSDAWSNGLLYNRLLEYYDSDNSNTIASVSKSKRSNGKRTSDWLKRNRVSAQKTYWSKHLEAIPDTGFRSPGFQKKASFKQSEDVTRFSIDTLYENHK